LIGLAIFALKSGIDFNVLHANSLNKSKQGIDPPEQGITGIILL
jgi:hypothetical protein